MDVDYMRYIEAATMYPCRMRMDGGAGSGTS